ncbi:MAG: AmmeMemoRadiSam system protein A [Desulfobacteraceae bacterium]|nr:AmmeMemoRadiSam system protein A [Desulfobacteraceae bacterium]
MDQIRENGRDKENSRDYSEEEGRLLVRLARFTIAEKLGVHSDKDERSELKKRLKQAVFAQKRGVFVTLHLEGPLRGCIGSLESDETVRSGVVENALNAAFRDPRFSPLTPEELERVDIEVSVLSTPEPLDHATPEELISKLEPGRDGVIISKGAAKATFLPQVWDQLSKASLFLSQLCLKAGLSSDAWKTEGVEVMTYRVQCFSETS